MVQRFRLREREQSPGEEIANSISHGVGALLATVAAVFIILTAVKRGSAFGIVGNSIFAGSMVLVYLSSTIYHSLKPNRAKRMFKIVDHSAIFLLIAGTYTPFTLGILRGAGGWTLLAVVWTISLGGIAFTALTRLRYPTVCTLIYLAMGWLFVVGGAPLWTKLAPWGMFWLAAGGVAYTAGIAFFALDRVRYGHLAWHVCVLLGTACHYIAVWRYSA